MPWNQEEGDMLALPPPNSGVGLAWVGMQMQQQPEQARWRKTRQNSPISHQAIRFSTNSKTCQMAVFTFSNAMI